MKEIDTKQVLETKIRIYDIPTLERLNVYFDKHQKLYRNKNDFYCHLLRNGLEVLEIQDENYDDYNGKIQSISDKLTKIISAMQEQNIINRESGQAEIIEQIYIQKMLARIYQIALANNEDYQLRRDFLESGAYDDLPADLLEEKLEMQDYYSVKTPNFDKKTGT